MIIERYLDAITRHDWDALRSLLHDDVVRVGPFQDEYRGRDDYVAFLTGLMPTLPDYSMEISRVTYAGTVAIAELAENVAGTSTDEALVFELDGDRIARIDIFIKTNAPKGFA